MRYMFHCFNVIKEILTSQYTATTIGHSMNLTGAFGSRSGGTATNKANSRECRWKIPPTQEVELLCFSDSLSSQAAADHLDISLLLDIDFPF
ncbi:unnamed protein product [Brassica oleracea]